MDPAPGFGNESYMHISNITSAETLPAEDSRCVDVNSFRKNHQGQRLGSGFFLCHSLLVLADGITKSQSRSPVNRFTREVSILY